VVGEVTVPEELNIRVEELTDEVRGLRFQMARRTRWVWGTIVVVVLVATLALGGAYYLIDRNNAKWCGTLNILTDPSAPKPTTARGRDQLGQLESLRAAFNCDRVAVPS
jgi:hypothetical protein